MDEAKAGRLARRQHEEGLEADLRLRPARDDRIGERLIRNRVPDERDPAVSDCRFATPHGRSPMDLLRTIGHRITEGPTLGYAILILALILAPRIAEVLRLPAMVGLVLAGMALGPHGAARPRHEGDRALGAGRVRPALPDVQRRPRAGPQAVHEDEARRDHVRAALVRVPVHARRHQRQAPRLRVGGGGADGLQLGLAHAGDLPDAPADGAVAEPGRRHRRRRHRRDRHLRAARPVGRVGRRQAEREPRRCSWWRSRSASPCSATWSLLGLPRVGALVLRARRDGPRVPVRVRHRARSSSAGCSPRPPASTASWARSSRASG